MSENDIDLEALSTDTHGYTVDDEDDDEPVLLDRDGRPVDTWRERYPYDERMSRDEYERLKRRLQIELLKLQNWSKRPGARHVIVFEGRDAAGKGGTIKRFTEHLNPRGARVVALEKPTEGEKPAVVLPALRQAPAHGRRNRPVRPLLVQPRRGRTGDGFLHTRAYAEFMRQAPSSNDMLVQ